MYKRLSGYLCGLALLVVVLSSQVIAQQCQTTWTQEVWLFPDPQPAGAVGCTYEGPWAQTCYVPTNSCSAPGPLVWCPTCGKFVPAAGFPINLTNGNTYIQETDFSVPGLGGGLTLTRTWNSIIPSSYSAYQVGMFGPNWRSTYEERVFSGSGNALNFMVYLREDGALWFFAPPQNGTRSLASPASVTATLTTDGSQSWTITFQNGEKRIFSYQSGSLTALIDRNGNAKQLSYDGSNRLTTVADAAGRHVYFNYPDGSSQLVTSVTSDIGITLTYNYDAQGRLSQVTRPDQSIVSFEYDANSMITAVKDSQGKLLESHTYDIQHRGLTSSRADGVDAVTVSYPN